MRGYKKSDLIFTKKTLKNQAFSFIYTYNRGVFRGCQRGRYPLPRILWTIAPSRNLKKKGGRKERERERKREQRETTYLVRENWQKFDLFLKYLAVLNL